jgi:HSP20 family protein
MSRHIVSPWELALLEHHLEELFEALARPPESPATGWMPPIDLIDRADGFVARIDLPGVSAADLEIVLHERELRISGTKAPGERGASPRRCHRVERSFGPFALHVHLPAPAAAGSCHAVLRHGVLEITLPHPDPRLTLPQRIEIIEEEP